MNKLRIGLILPDNMIPAWVRLMIETMKNSSYADISSLAFADHSNGEQAVNKQYDLQFNLDKRLFRPDPEPWGLSDVRMILHNTQVLGANLHERLMRLKGLRIDLLLNLSLERLPKSILEVARFGIWSLRCNDTHVTVNSEIGWLEILNDIPVMHCDVEIQRQENTLSFPGSVMATNTSSISLNQSAYFWRAARVLPRAIKQLQQTGDTEFFSHTSPVSPAAKAEMPTSVQSKALAQKQALDISDKKIFKRINRQPWALMTGKQSNGTSFDWKSVKVKSPPRDTFWADPFLLKKQDKTYLFFEEFSYRSNRGRIAYSLIDNEGNITDPQPALERPYHLAYPYVFEHRGEFYMIPETSQNRSIEAYRCVRFPDQWELHKTLIPNIRAVDATLIEHGVRWWMFVNVGHEGGSTWDELHVYFSDDPLSEDWTPHPLNPVVSDVRSARPAGNIFRKDGGFIRPSQDCSHRYGYAINFNRILKLTPTEYEEERIDRIEPNNEDVLGIHTYNTLGELVVVDAKLKE